MERRISHMDPGLIAASGQCFRMEAREDGRFSVIAGGRYLEVQNIGNPEYGNFWFSCGEEEFDRFWSHYFDLETDYGKIKKKIAKRDQYLTEAAKAGWGIRILNQDIWETVITFIISQQNHISRIRRCVRLLCERYGEEMQNFRGEVYYAFPEPARLAGAAEEDLRECNLGYRARYIKETAQMAADGRFSPEGLRGISHEAAKKELLALSGVGAKVAECVCLFGLHHLDAFPVDTHIAKVLERRYPEGFPFSRYRKVAGVLQQYMFYYDLEHSRKDGCKGVSESAHLDKGRRSDGDQSSGFGGSASNDGNLCCGPSVYERNRQP